jgi:DNA-binding NtrC family response regulator
MEKRRILIVEDDRHMLGLLKSALEQEGFVPLPASDCDRALRIVTRAPSDLAILDYKLPRATSGLELARLIRRHDARLPIIMITSYSTEDLAIEALRGGFDDYFRKPFLIQDLLGSIQRLLLSRGPIRWQAAAGVRGVIPELRDGSRMIGESGAVWTIRQFIHKLGRSESTVLILGETGTGKELVAELIHSNGRRAGRPFVRVNCAAIPDTLLESELFGYERGAFTGAYAARAGTLELADGGTVFLDEIGDMSLSAQAKMLRVLDKRSIQRVGGRRDVTLDARIIAATNQNLDGLMASGRFRRDLYFRLNVAQIVLPPLRDRKEDLPRLIDHFICELNDRLGKRIQGVSGHVLDRMLQYDWPGNIRELRNVLEGCVLNLESGEIGLADLPDHYRGRLERCAGGERDLLLSALFSTKWNKSLAAQKLHWSRMTLYRKLAKYRIWHGV